MSSVEKYRLKDNNFLSDIQEKMIQVRHKLEEKVEETQIPLSFQPMSVIPSELMYAISLGFTSMYEKLLEYELLQAGFPKSQKKIH